MYNYSQAELVATLDPLLGYSDADLDEMLRGAHQILRDRGELIEHQGPGESFVAWRESLMTLASKALCKDGAPVSTVMTVVDVAQAIASAAIPTDLVGSSGKDIACILAAQVIKTGLQTFCVNSTQRSS